MRADQIRYKRLCELTFQQTVQLWNDGFSGYYSDMSMNEEQLLDKIVRQGIRPELSVAACDGERPVGFVLIALRLENGRQVGWNGGTGVHPDYRGIGLGKLLMQEAAAIMAAEGFDSASLEVVKKNSGAVKVYEHAGFRIVRGVSGYRHPSGLASFGLKADMAEAYRLLRVHPAEAGALPFYDSSVVWESRWYNLMKGQALIVADRNGAFAGYVLYQRHYDDRGGLRSITLHQCGTAPGREDTDSVVRFALHHAFAADTEPCARSVADFPQEQESVNRILLEAGFEVAHEQYQMVLTFKETKNGGGA